MLIFLTIGALGFIWLAMSLLTGHDHDHEIEHEVGHDTEHGDHDTSGDAPAVSYFSSKVLATLVMGFGAAGGIADYEGFGWLSSSLWGLGSGFLLSLIMYFIMYVLYGQQGSSIIPSGNAVGKHGEVTVTIGENETGEVGLTVNNSYVTYTARSANGQSILRGHTVVVESIAGSTLVVRPANASA